LEGLLESSDDAHERSTGISTSSTLHGAYRVCTSRSLPHANDEPSGSILGEMTTHGRNTTTMPDDVQMALPGTYMSAFFLNVRC
jgi:hypothetical protein